MTVNRIDIYYIGSNTSTFELSPTGASLLPAPGLASLYPGQSLSSEFLTVSGQGLNIIASNNEAIMQVLAAIIDKLPAITAPFCIFVSTLASSDIKVTKPIPVTIEMESDDSFIASFVDAGVSTGGSSLQDAVWSLQEMLASSYRMLAPMSNSQLGPKMQREKAVLSEFLCRPSPKRTPKIQQKS